MQGVFAEFELAMIRELLKAGLATARAKGVRLGAPRKGDKVLASVEKERAKGLFVRAIIAMRARRTLVAFYPRNHSRQTAPRPSSGPWKRRCNRIYSLRASAGDEGCLIS
jgi:DNA invertase Pin-like site-specific DNA recombinase